MVAGMSHPVRSTVLERIGAHAPFLRDAIGLHPDIGEMFLRDGAAGAIVASARVVDGPLESVLRQRRMRLALALALGDLAAELPLEAVTGALSDFADEAIDAALRAAFAERMPEAEFAGITVLAMGKLGSRELNFSSDVDLIALYDPETMPRRPREDPGTAAVRVAKRMIELLQARTADGYVVRVDMRLRPAPEVTPIALPIDAALSHYESSALPWERAAFIRGRVCAGDRALGDRFMAAIEPFVWRRSLDFGVVEEIRAISTRIRDHYGQGQRLGPGFDLKRGRGGIREVEFFAQILQLIHAGRDHALRAPGTIAALDALGQAGLIEPEEATALGEAYRLLRTIEHRVQMVADQQTHLLPADRQALDGVARLHGLDDGSALLALLAAPVARIEAAFGEIAAAEKDDALATEPAALIAQLEAWGFGEPAVAAARVGEWRAGQARSLRSPAAREALETMLPPLLRAIGGGPDPARALNRLSTLFERLSSGVNLYRLVGARPELGQTLALILGQAPALADQLARRADLLDGLIDESDFAEPLDADAVEAALSRVGGAGYDETLDRVRRWVNERRFALGVQVVARTRDPLRIAAGYAAVAEGTVRALAEATAREFATRHGRIEAGGLAILGLGRLGGAALTPASDLDLIYLFDAPTGAQSDGEKPLGATEYYNRLASRIGAALSVSTGAGPLYEIDTRLRPQGAKGLLAVRIDAFAEYQRNEAWTFEHMALTRARVLAGPVALGARVEALIAELLVPDPARRVIADAAAMRDEMAAHKPAGGAWDVKLGPGGLVDLEFAVHARQLTTGIGLTPRLAEAIDALEAAGLAPTGIRAAHDLMTRLLVMLRLIAPDGGEPPAASRDLIAAGCEAHSWPGLLAALAEARQGVASWWQQVREQA